jgi:hypothetical protein
MAAVQPEHWLRALITNNMSTRTERKEIQEFIESCSLTVHCSQQALSPALLLCTIVNKH